VFRGGRAKFPSTAVIVAEANRVIIYDGDDPTLPMWRSYVGSSLNSALSFFYPNTLDDGDGAKLAAINGSVYMSIDYANVNGGLRRLDFIGDRMKRYTASITEKYNGTSQPLADIETNPTTPDGQNLQLADYSSHDVAVTVLPDAPIEAETGLPAPTIAVATVGGISVIKNHEQVFDIRNGDAANHGYAVAFTDDNRVACQLYDDNRGIRIFDMPSSDITQGNHYSQGFANEWYADTVYAQGNDVRLLGRASGGLGHQLRLVAYQQNICTGLYDGISIVARNSSDQNKSMVAYVTSAYNTGWMIGDIKGAFLSDTNDTDLADSGELITNGTFDSDLTAWTDASIGSESASVSSGQLVLNRVDSSNSAKVYQAITTNAGGVYAITLDISGAGLYVRAGTGTSGSSAYDLLDENSTGNALNFQFVATGSTTYITIGPATANGVTGTVDNVSVKLADADRSLNDSSLITKRKITRTPVATGADLVCYSGFDFAATKYLSQPYNADMAFGSGDFCIMWWNMAVTTIVQNRWLFGLFDPIGLEKRHVVYMVSGGQLRLLINNDDYAVVNGAVPSADQWGLFSYVRKDGVVSLYRNGVLLGSESAPVAINSATTDELRIGGVGALGPDLSKFALLRISATAPTADQIKKIYEDEKVLFQENAKCTLHGTSDAVTELAHDKATNLLHVGTSSGRSVFDGLARVEHTTTPVTTAISAANGLVEEE